MLGISISSAVTELVNSHWLSSEINDAMRDYTQVFYCYDYISPLFSAIHLLNLYYHATSSGLTASCTCNGGLSTLVWMPVQSCAV